MRYCYLLGMLLTFCFCGRGESLTILQEASEKNLPIVAIFLGEEGCPWSQRMQRELLESSFFKHEVESAALVWQLSLSQNLESHALSEQYKVHQFPCILLLDPEGKEFARLDYEASDPEPFSKNIASLIVDFHDVCHSVDKGLKELDEKRLQTLYLQASRLSTPCFKQLILNQGLKKERETFFHVEKYERLLQKLKLRHPEVVKLKKELLSRDPDNKWGTQRKIALLEFEKNRVTLKRKARMEKVIHPLVSYLERFGSEDVLHRWKLEMSIADFFFAKHDLPRALEYANRAKESAPQEFKPQIIKTLAYMQEN